MGGATQAAVDAINEICRRKEAGEITHEECIAQSLPFAEIVNAARAAEMEADPGPEAPHPSDVILRFVEFSESNPRVVQAIVVGMIAALGHYARSGGEGEADGR